jgi:hypothetical protein
MTAARSTLAKLTHRDREQASSRRVLRVCAELRINIAPNLTTL